MTTYDDELSGLSSAFNAALLEPDDYQLAAALEFLNSGPVYAVASGGAVPAAQFAADLHNQHRVAGAEVLSPLAFVQKSSRLSAGTLLLLSARAKHPDTAFAVRVAMNSGFRVVLITQRNLEDLDVVYRSPLVVVVTVPAPNGSDGFLATQSVLVMSVVVARIYGQDVTSAADFVAPVSPLLTRRLIVVSGTDELVAASDIEVRLHELGLADVQLTDYRNLAHGRHVGLSRRIEDTTVLFLVSPTSRGIADRTRKALPPDVSVVELSTNASGPVGALELLIQAMKLPQRLASEQGVQPHRPRVPAFGRELYHLPFKRLFPSHTLDPVGRKLREAGLPADAKERPIYEDAYTQWRAQAMKAHIRGLLLDYDGTCVVTRHRWSLPTQIVQDALLSLLEQGIVVGFASGRGRSLHRDLRQWVPKQYWNMIWLGLHNGTLPMKLSAEMPATDRSDEGIESLRERLRPFEDAGTFSVDVSGSQMSLTSAVLSVEAISGLTNTAASRDPRLVLRVQASAHSVDVIPALAGKDTYLRTMQEQISGDILVVGDQGNLGGNDFAMLAATPLSISVDRCSADPTRCWNITSADTIGPDALVASLAMLQERRGRIGYFPPALRS